MNLWAKFPLFKERKKYIAEQEKLEEKLMEQTKQLGNLGYETITAASETMIEKNITRAGSARLGAHASISDSDLTDGDTPKLPRLHASGGGSSNPSPTGGLLTSGSGEVRIEVEARPRVTQEQFHIFMRLACAYHERGAPSPKVEAALTEVTKHFGLVTSWMVTPTSIHVSFGDPFELSSVTRTARVGQIFGSIIYLDRIEGLMIELLEGKLRLSEVVDRLDAINQLQPYGFWTKLFASVLTSCGASVVFYGGGWYEMLLAFILGFIIQLNRAYSTRNHFLSITTEFWNSLLASFLCTILGALFDPHVCFAPPVMAALVWDLPGIGIAMALRELAQGHTVSGTSRLARALIVALSMAYGILIGTDIVLWVPFNGDIVSSCTIHNHPFPGWYSLLWFPMVITGLFFLIDAEMHHYPGVFCVAFIGLATNYFLKQVSARFLHADVIVIASSFAVGMIGRLISRYTRTSSVVYVFAGTLVLLPGGVSVKAIYDMLKAPLDPASKSGGMNFGIDMMIIAFELCIGSMLSNMIPIKALGRVKLFQSW